MTPTTKAAIAGAIKGLLAGLRFAFIFLAVVLAIVIVKWGIGDYPGHLPDILLAFVYTRAWFGLGFSVATLLGAASFGALEEMGKVIESGTPVARFGCFTWLALAFAAGFLVFRVVAPHLLRPGTDDMSPFGFAIIGGAWTIMSGVGAVALLPILVKAFRERQ
jgi:hypothetical protein